MTTTHTDDVSASTPSARQPRSHAAPAGTEQRRQVNLLAGLGHIALVIWALLVLLPLIWTFLAAFKSNAEIFGDAWTLPSHWSFASFGRAWSKAHISTYMFNSVVIVVFSTFGTMLFGSMAAYVLARYQFWGNRFVYYLFVAGLAFPVFLAIV